MPKLTFLLYVILLVPMISVGCKKKASGDLIAGNGTSNPGGSTPEVPPPVDNTVFGRMFVTTGTVAGNYAAGGGAPKFDAICTSEATALGLTGKYRALIATDGETQNRFPCVTAECGGGASENHKWVLKANTQYRRIDGTTVIGTTNAAGILDSQLTNPVVSGPATPIWTGLTTDWTISSTTYDNCAKLRYSEMGITGDVGDASSIADLINYNPGQPCTGTHPFVCVELVPVVTTLTAQPAYRKIFLSSPIVFDTNGLSSPKALLDGHCQAEANAKGIGHDGKTRYKALFQNNNTANDSRDHRTVCFDQYCASGNALYSWPLEANRQYRREDGTTVIASTNNYSFFDYPLTNSITGTNVEYWTGINLTWQTGIAQNSSQTCSGYYSNSSGASGLYGVGDVTDSDSISKNTTGCGVNRGFLCVEQTRAEDVFYDYSAYHSSIR